MSIEQIKDNGDTKYICCVGCWNYRIWKKLGVKGIKQIGYLSPLENPKFEFKEIDMMKQLPIDSIGTEEQYIYSVKRKRR